MSQTDRSITLREPTEKEVGLIACFGPDCVFLYELAIPERDPQALLISHAELRALADAVLEVRK